MDWLDSDRLSSEVMPDDQTMRTPGQAIKGKEDQDTRTCQDQQRCQPTTFSELYVSVESVANHDRAFGVKINPTIDHTHKHTHEKTEINQHVPDDTPQVS
jgi:hypothetical protein